MIKTQKFLNVIPQIGFWKFYIDYEGMKLGFFMKQFEILIFF